MHPCKHCGEPASDQNIFCSRECYFADRAPQKWTECEWCHERMRVKFDSGKQRKYCSIKCSGAARAHNRLLERNGKKRCCRCKQYLDPGEFYFPTLVICKTCQKQDAARRVFDAKLFVVDLLGGKCEECGYDKCLGSLDLHHNDPSLKVTPWSKARGRGREFLRQWVINEKISLLCRNCHGEVHWISTEPFRVRERYM